MFDCLCCRDDQLPQQYEAQSRDRPISRIDKVQMKPINVSHVQTFNPPTGLRIQSRVILPPQHQTTIMPVTAFNQEQNVGMSPAVIAAKQQQLHNLKIQQQILTHRINLLDKVYFRDIAPLEQRCQQLRIANNHRSQQIAVLNDRVRLIQKFHAPM